MIPDDFFSYAYIFINYVSKTLLKISSDLRVCILIATIIALRYANHSLCCLSYFRHMYLVSIIRYILNTSSLLS